MSAIIEYLWNTLSITFFQLFVLMGPGVILTMALHYVSKLVESRAYALLGRNAYLGLLGWLGTTVHEMGHAALCLVFGHKIIDLNIFNPDPHSSRLGYVKHSYNPNNYYQAIGNFFIAIGPILLGALVIYGATDFLLGPELFRTIRPITLDSTPSELIPYAIHSLSGLLQNIKDIIGLMASPEYLANWKLYLVLYIVFSVGSSMTLSPSDLQGAYYGLGALVTLVFIFNLATLGLSREISVAICYSILYLSKYVSIFYAILIYSLVMNLLTALVLLTIPVVFRLIHKISS